MVNTSTLNITGVLRDFRAKADFQTDGEVSLFRNLAQSIQKHSNAIFIDETHGSVAQVEFTSPIKGKQRCEISDLVIAIKDTFSGSIRATFWQAKKESSPKWPLADSDANFDFKAQFNQWELLSQRPTIKACSQFQPHEDLLSSASSPSIGSFGIFYELNGNIEVNYSVAEAITSSAVSSNPRMVINNQLKNYKYYGYESIVLNNLKSFLKGINNFSVGAILNPTSQSDTWLADYLNYKCRSNDKQPFVDSEWFNPPPTNRLFKGEGVEGDGISVLMIEVIGPLRL